MDPAGARATCRGRSERTLAGDPETKTSRPAMSGTSSLRAAPSIRAAPASCMKAGGAEPSASRARMRAPERSQFLGVGQFGGILGQVQQDHVPVPGGAAGQLGTGTG